MKAAAVDIAPFTARGGNLDLAERTAACRCLPDLHCSHADERRLVSKKGEVIWHQHSSPSLHEHTDA